MSTYSTILPLQDKGRSGRNENKEIEKRNLICLSGKFHIQAYVLKLKVGPIGRWGGMADEVHVPLSPLLSRETPQAFGD